MPLFSSEQLKKVGFSIFKQMGAPENESAIVSNSLVESNLAGHDSHGVIRIPQYVMLIKKGDILPGAKMEIIRETPSTAVLNGNWGFGQVMGKKRNEIANREKLVLNQLLR